MRSPMDEQTFLNFYKNTVSGYSNNLQRHICCMLENEKRISFDPQNCSYNDDGVLCFESKKDYKDVIAKTTVNLKFASFYEQWEYIKLYKYSVPLFYEIEKETTIENLLIEKKNIPLRSY